MPKRKISSIKTKQWECTTEDGDMVSCEHKKTGNLLSAFDDGTVRFSKEKKPVKVEGETARWKGRGEELYGVELN